LMWAVLAQLDAHQIVNFATIQY